jgi:putative membrane protein
MSEGAYNQFSREQLILRDHLAIDRTILANERTFLAYVRTGLAMAVTGAACLKVFTSLAMHVTGYVFIATGIGVLCFGVYRCRTMHQKIASCRAAASRTPGTTPS